MNDTDMVLKKLMNKIFSTTAIIQKEFPELYIYLSETPLFLSYDEKDIEMIICTSSDRFSQSLLKAVELLQKLLKAGVELKFIDDTPKDVEFRRIESEIIGTYYQKKKI